ncbi:metal-dependent hydrolase [Halomonas dongshanensis]|uniref:Metal-dependent hydrolase n=1 Tax=Halomonas dongshanensis TaxID=2890835 RepID=A0ABT2EGN6_9GAMM|nr:metal-dependent hydrolase [Halomonas dongshanensis]
MDSVTQAALGAAVGGAVLGRRLGRKAILIGALLGTLPDLDVVIDYGDAVANVTEHRGFSHSLFVLTGVGTLLALICHRFAPPRDVSFRAWWLFFVLCLVTHPLLDALTTYGTQLFWPLAGPPVAWPIIFIIDPFYTLPLLAALGAGLLSQNVRRACTWGLALSTLYLTLAAGAKWHVERQLAPALAERGLTEAPRLVQPTPFNVLLWRVTVMNDTRYYEGLVSVFDGDHLPHLEALTRNAELEPFALASPQGQRLAWFSGPFLRFEVAQDPSERGETLLATDIRLGFPGFHPFNFALATREGSDEWLPADVTDQISAPRGLSLETLSRLTSRALGDPSAMCISDFVAREWRTEPLVEVC